jgi:cephalosporin hydroxylase
VDPDVLNRYHDWWARDHAGWQYTSWRGVYTAKCPTDLIVVADLIHEVRPDWIIETGTYAGGSALFYGDLCRLARHGHVVTIDVNKVTVDHPRVSCLHGDSLTVELPPISGTVMVMLDSDHSAGHVYAELERFGPLVTPGSYLIVEDTWSGGPAEALDKWLPDHPEFEWDPWCERFALTMYPGGWLRRAA